MKNDFEEKFTADIMIEIEKDNNELYTEDYPTSDGVLSRYQILQLTELKKIRQILSEINEKFDGIL